MASSTAITAVRPQESTLASTPQAPSVVVPSPRNARAAHDDLELLQGSHKLAQSLFVGTSRGLAGLSLERPRSQKSPVAVPAPWSKTSGARAEWHRPTDILMHKPGNEVLFGLAHPAAALFERPFSLAGARREQDRYIAALEKRGAHVHTVEDTLAPALDVETAELTPAAKVALERLRDLAERSVRFDTSKLGDDGVEHQRAKRTYLEAMDPESLLNLIMLRPVVELSRTATNTGFAAEYRVDPLMNLYFLRDQSITTAKGVVVASLNSPQRCMEPEVISTTLAALGVDPIYRVQGTGRLEGGDFITAGGTCFLGQGVRTNAEAVRQLLDHQAFGTPRVVIVKDRFQDQTQMHLDTYFNIAGPKVAVLIESRVKPTRPEMVTTADVYELTSSGYVLARRDVGFPQLLGEMGFKVIPVTERDQANYAINFLCVGPNDIIAVSRRGELGPSEKYKQDLLDAGVKVEWLDFTNLTGGFGAAHCMTQPYRRVLP